MKNCDCERHIHTSEFDLYFYRDEVLVLPPPKLLIPLATAEMNGRISRRAAKATLHSWLNNFSLALVSFYADRCRPSTAP